MPPTQSLERRSWTAEELATAAFDVVEQRDVDGFDARGQQINDLLLRLSQIGEAVENDEFQTFKRPDLTALQTVASRPRATFGVVQPMFDKPILIGGIESVEFTIAGRDAGATPAAAARLLE